MTRHAAPLALILALAACGDRDAPRRVNSLGSPPSSAAPPPAAASADPDDPAEPGISDLTRLARYVFRTMRDHEAVCPIENQYRDTLHFAFAVDVAGGRMTRVGLAEVGFEGPSGPHSLPKAVWPRELVGYVGCLAPHLEAVQMRPAPADGGYQPFYSFAGRPDGITPP